MPISTTARKTQPFVGNGTLVSLPFAFKVFAVADVRVVRTNSAGESVDLVLGSDYNVSLNANQDIAPGGNVNLTTSLATGSTAVVVSAISDTQSTNLQNAGGFYPAVITAALDRAVALIQQLRERQSRAPALPVADSATWPELPMPALRRNSVLGFNSAGDPTLISTSSLTAPAPSPGDGGGGGGGSGGLTIALSGVGALLPTSFELSMTVSGTLPAGASMRLEWTDNAASGPWRASPQVAAALGNFTRAFTGAPANTTLFYRGVVYSVAPPPVGSLPTGAVETIHAVSTVGTFTTPATGGALTLVNGAPASVTANGFTLSVTIGGTIPSGAVVMIQWTDNAATGPWRDSPRVAAAAGVFSHPFTGAPANTQITWRAFVFNEPSTIHIQSANSTFTTSAAGAATTYAITFIGDSIFAGAGDSPPSFFSPRGDFQGLLTSAGVSYNMIGPYTGGAGGGADPDHGAAGGRAIDSVASGNNVVDNLPVILGASYNPDIIIVHVGWNDLFLGGTIASGAPARYEAMYNDIRTRKPSAKILLCTLSQPAEPFPYSDANYLALNTRIRNICAANPSTTKLCDLATIQWLPGDLADYVHLATPGAAKMAQRIYSDLVATGLIAPSTAPSPSLMARLIDHMGAQQLNLNNLPQNAGWRLGGIVVKGGDLRAIANPSWWTFNPRLDLGDYWRFMIPWTVVWDIVGHLDGLNTRYAERNIELWALHDDTNTWERLSVQPTPTGDAFERSMLNPQVGNLDTRVEADGSSSVRFGPLSQFVWHGYGAWGSTTRPERVRALMARAQVRKMLHNPAGTDDRASARYAVHVGVDPYPSIGGPQQFGSAAAFNPGSLVSRFVEVTNDWQWVYAVTLAEPPTFDVDAGYPYNFRQTITQSALAANLPPL